MKKQELIDKLKRISNDLMSCLNDSSLKRAARDVENVWDDLDAMIGELEDEDDEPAEPEEAAS